MSSEQYDDILEFAISLAERASKMIVDGRAEMWTKPRDVTSKLSSVDVSVCFQSLALQMVSIWL
jgi:hypothetical protein